MSQDWLLIETLGEQPAVVAQGRRMKSFVPITVFFRRHPHLGAIRAAIAQTIADRSGVVLSAATGNRVIRTEPVAMTDGRIHGVQLCYGPPDSPPPERPLPGAWKSDPQLTSSVTPQFLVNIGKDPTSEPLTGRSIADDIPAASFNPGETQVLSWAIDLQPGRTFASNWEFRDDHGAYRRVGFCIRLALEAASDGAEHLTGRSMNVLESVSDVPQSKDQLAQRMIDGMARPGVHRAIIDLNTWNLIKWVDEPCPFYDWRAHPPIHPEDREELSQDMRQELAFDHTTAVLRLPAHGGGWKPVHVTINPIELDDGIVAGLAVLRRPTEEEIIAAGLSRDHRDGH